MIETKRLLLRPHRIEDFEKYVPLWTSVAPIERSIPGLVLLRTEDIWARLLRLIGHWTVFGFGPFVVVDRPSGDIVGEVGFAHFRRGNGPDFDNAPEAMWRIHSDHRGKGIAAEAVEQAVGWFDGRQAVIRTVCMIAPTNTGSLSIAAAQGFRQFSEVVYRDNTMLLFERVRSPRSGG